jgi:transcriptional regulator with XRE-family HTH domain
MSNYDELIKSFAERVRELRESQGHTQEKFAHDAAIDRSYYGRIERGKANPTLRHIAAIAESLDMSISELLTGIGNRRKSRKR